MSTTTINPTVITAGPADVISDGIKSGSSLLMAFWYRIKATVAPMLKATAAYIKGLVARAAALVPHPVLALAAPLVLVTRFGYGLVTKAASFVADVVGWTVKKASSLVHRAIDWVGYRIADLVNVFSAPAAARVSEAVKGFSNMRVVAGQIVKTVAAGARTRASAAFQAPTTRGAVAVTSGAVAGVIALNAFAPASFSTVLAGMSTTSAATLAAVSMGGWVSLMPIIGVAGIAMFLNLLLSLFPKDRAIQSEVIQEQTPVLTGEVVEGEVVDSKVMIEVLPDGSIHAEADGQEVTIPFEQTQEGMLEQAAEAIHEARSGINSAKPKSYPAKPKGKKA